MTKFRVFFSKSGKVSALVVAGVVDMCRGHSFGSSLWR